MPIKLKRNFFKKILFILTLFTLGTFANANAEGEEAWTRGWLEGASGYSRALDAHMNGNRTLVLYIYADWCPYCEKFEKNILSSPQVMKFMQDKIKVRINPEKGDREAAIARKYGARGYPSFYILPPGTRIAQKLRIQGGPEQFIASFTKAVSRKRS